MTIKYLTILFAFCLISCNSTPNEKVAEKEEQTLAPEIEYYETMPTEKAKELYDTADKVDIIFYNMSVSISQFRQKDVQGQVSFLMPGQVPKKLDCSATANIIFQAQGEIVGDGRMYLRGNCRYVVFYEDNEPVYAAFINDQGMQFFQKVLSAGNSTVKE